MSLPEKLMFEKVCRLSPMNDLIMGLGGADENVAQRQRIQWLAVSPMADATEDAMLRAMVG